MFLKVLICLQSLILVCPVQISKDSILEFLFDIHRKEIVHADAHKTCFFCAYPFALIKPCGIHVNVTLKDINQRIHTLPSKSKHNIDDDSYASYPTSAFSGKPLIVKTKIRTEGGKGSIIIDEG
uniref:Uncharacterized protein n=1 Tax=Nelumbo nucifera TaxID=4432 RepID=A0A822XKB4_NELNU|nr:TPA_asm: hypothetical protein HUJ06_020992 [Nelumbo nucifera]